MIGRALMLPISLLPAAGLLLAFFGDKFHLPLMMNAGGLSLITCRCCSPSALPSDWLRNRHCRTLSAAVSVFVTNITISTVLSITPEMASQGGKYAMVVGIPTLQMGVFGGLICGTLAAWCTNRFHTMQLPEFLGFFSGKRFVAIATAFVVVPARPAAAVRLAAYSVRDRRPVRGGEMEITRRPRPLSSGWWSAR